jgi:hypothetical protein
MEFGIVSRGDFLFTPVGACRKGDMTGRVSAALGAIRFNANPQREHGA